MKKVMKGTVCATITPFTPDGKLDEDSVKSLCGFLKNTELDCVYPLGTNGEGAALSQSEKKMVIDIYIKELGGKKPISIQCGGVTLSDTMEIMEYAKFSGAQAAGIITPYFFKQDAESLYGYYAALARQAGDFPLYIYNIPPNSNDDISADTVAKLAQDFENIAGIKYSFPDLLRIQDYIRAKDGFDVLIGCDRLYLPTLALGGVGTVSGPAVIYDKLFSRIYSHMQNNDYVGALEYQKLIEEQDKALAGYQGIPLLKVFLKKKGIIACEKCRVPFKEIRDAQRTDIMNVIGSFL